MFLEEPVGEKERMDLKTLAIYVAFKSYSSGDKK